MTEQSDIDVIKQRKLEGLNVPLTNEVQAKTTSTYLEYVQLVHNALPELDFDELDTSTTMPVILLLLKGAFTLIILSPGSG